MKVTEHIARAEGHTLFSFEVIPPPKGTGIEELYRNIDPLMEFKPPFIDVTTSREESVYVEKAPNLFENKITRRRPGTIGICAALQYKYGVDTVPHLLCGGYTKAESEYALIDCSYLGIDNVMALRGDSRKDETRFVPTEDGHNFASDLVKQIRDLEKGHYQDGIIESDSGPSFCIGVAGYPEKHMEAPALTYDLEMLKKKVDNGADYIVTQMFFDNQKFFDFVKATREIGITVPIIPGIKPLAVKSHLNMLPQVFKIDLPEALIAEVVKAKDTATIREVGIEWAIHQCRELREFGVPLLHFYSMGKSDNIYKIARELF